jgi:starch synthase
VNVIYASSEIVPFASSGGLGDVAAALPPALAAQGIRVSRVMPLYRHVTDGPFDLEDTGLVFDTPLGHDVVRAEIWATEEGGVRTYFVRRDEFFDRRELYSLPERDYDDNFARFVFFQKAVVQLIDALGETVDIVHCNDWQTALLPLYLEHGVHGLGRGGGERTVITIHNLAFQGLFPSTLYYLANLPLSELSIDSLEFYGQISCLKGGLTSADRVTTVSMKYAEEICGEEMGCGLAGLLASLGPRLTGIVNGVDYTVWDPAQDAYLAETYSASNPAGKRQCKRALLREMGLTPRPGTALLGMVSRLTDQKGLDILAKAMPEIMKRSVQFVLLGSGEEKYHKLCREWAKQWPDRFVPRLGFDTALAHRIEAGADLFVMPSRYEPCGLNQMYSLRYGTLPLVHATGGLEDTIVDLDENPKQGTGVKFREYAPKALVEALDRALERYLNPQGWKKIVTRAMKQDFSWHESAQKYLELYEELLASPTGR